MFGSKSKWLGFLLITSCLGFAEHGEVDIPRPRTLAPHFERNEDGNFVKQEGLRFKCSSRKIKRIERQMQQLFDKFGLDPELVKITQESGSLQLVLDTPASDTSTVDLHKRAKYRLHDEVLKLPMADGTIKEVSAVSQKEIFLALMQHGRLTEFSGKNCSVDALMEHIGIRQNIAAWVEGTSWVWPDIEHGGRVKWNENFWNRGELKPGVSPSEAFADVFKDPKKYQLACYSMAKIAMGHGMMDYYTRIKPNPRIVKKIERDLMRGSELLLDIDATVDADNVTAVDEKKPLKDPTKVTEPGKILDATIGVAARNWIPGDWGYFLNPDKKSANNAGYEGSNSIYMGRDKFDDYYHEHGGSYTFREKLEEVYQWRDKDIQKPITPELLKELAKTPELGGVVESYRNIPYFY